MSEEVTPIERRPCSAAEAGCLGMRMNSVNGYANAKPRDYWMQCPMAQMEQAGIEYLSKWLSTQLR